MPIPGATPRVRARLQQAGSLALGLGVNVLAVTLLAVGAHRHFAPAASPPIELQLLPPLMTPIRPAPERGRDTPIRSPAAIRPHLAPATATPAPAVAATPNAPPAAPVAPVAPSGAAAGSGDLGRILRASLGCSDPTGLKLTAEERARCAARLGQGARQAAPIQAPLDPGKRAWFDATHAAYHPSDPMDGSIPVFGCKVRFGGPHSKFKPAHSLKVPGLPCYLIPPRGVLTEESAIAPPEHVETR